LYSFDEKRLQVGKPQTLASYSASSSSSGDDLESFEAVCAVYESTLRFLSMVYDANLQGVKLKVVRTIFANVASPHAPYQEKYAMMEKYYTKYYNTKYTSLVSDIQAVGDAGRTLTKANSSNSNDGSGGDALTNLLQTSAEQMTQLTVGVFPVVEGKLFLADSRF
jgi:hypothetical protein